MDAYCNRQSQNRKLDMIPTCADGNLDSIPKTHFLEQIASIFLKNNIQQTQTKVGIQVCRRSAYFNGHTACNFEMGMHEGNFLLPPFIWGNMHEGNFECRSGLQMQKSAPIDCKFNFNQMSTKCYGWGTNPTGDGLGQF